MSLHIAKPHAQATNLVMTAATAPTIGLMLLMSSRHQRRMPTSRHTTGLVIIVLSAPFLAAGVIELLGALLLLRH